MNYVQSFISNISFPTTLDEVELFSDEFNVEMILRYNYTKGEEWTAPKWCKKGDIVFFMHARGANQIIRRLKKQLLNNESNYSENDYQRLLNSLIRAKALHDTYGGKIFAIGKISGELFLDDISDNAYYHWSSNLYAPIESIFLLEKPVDLSEFKSFIQISNHGSITPVFGKEFDSLKELILKKNKLIPNYFKSSVAELIPFPKVNSNNWIEVLNKYRRSFFLEIQFRTYYVDRLLKELGDIKTFYRECPCQKGNLPTSYVDNVIKFNGKYLTVEVKFSLSAEKNIINQVIKYCELDSLVLDNKKTIGSNDTYSNCVLIIDTDNVYLYDNIQKNIINIFNLNNINKLEDIYKLKTKLSMYVK